MDRATSRARLEQNGDGWSSRNRGSKLRRFVYHAYWRVKRSFSNSTFRAVLLPEISIISRAVWYAQWEMDFSASLIHLRFLKCKYFGENVDDVPIYKVFRNFRA